MPRTQMDKLKRNAPIASALICMVLIVFAASSGQGQNKKQKREAAYQAELQAYSEILKPGMTRKDVESYFRSKGVAFQRSCCIDERTAYTDLVQIGKEKHSWYCSEHAVYVAFQFVDESNVDPRPSRQDLDKLKSISIYHRAEGCL